PATGFNHCALHHRNDSDAAAAAFGIDLSLRRADVNAATASVQVHVRTHGANLDTTAASLRAGAAANVVKVDASAPTGRIHASRNTVADNSTAVGLNFHRVNVAWDVYHKVAGEFPRAVAFPFGYQEGCVSANVGA